MHRWNSCAVYMLWHVVYYVILRDASVELSRKRNPCINLVVSMFTTDNRWQMKADLLAASHWASSILLAPSAFNTPIFAKRGPKSLELCSSPRISLNAFLYTSWRPYSAASLIHQFRFDFRPKWAHLRKEVVPINHIFRYVLYCILEEEVIRMSINAFMFPFSEFDWITWISKFRFSFWQIIQSAPGL